jgi:hypothetical protein
LRALIVSGGGDYTDPWHPFATTTGELATILRELGHEVTVSDRVEETLAGLVDPATWPDLLVINAGNAEQPGPADPAVATGVLAYLAAGHPLLVSHISATAFVDWPEWEAILGGRWVRGTSMHPDQDLARVEVATDAHPIVAGVVDFTVFDERYSYLRLGSDIEQLAWHEHDGLRHPLLWVHSYGPARVVYDALGHDGRSYESAEHRMLVARSAQWLLGELD